MTAVFAVEDTAIQLHWRTLRGGEHSVAVGDTCVTVVGDDGPAVALVEGLEPDIAYDVVVDGRRVTAARTLLSPPGAELCRFATVSDLHIGGPRFGLLPAARDDDHPDGLPPQRCLRAALTEIVAWGASLLVVKGDITDHGRPEEWEEVAALLRSTGLPVEATVGNHDVQPGAVDGRAALTAAGIRLTVDGVASRDLPGARLVLADSTRPDDNRGTMARSGAAILELAAEAPGAVVVAQHHQLRRHRLPTYWPLGVPAGESRRFLDQLTEANPAAMVTSGHTHRYRARRHGPVLVTEVGSPKDYPGGWAGYVVHEGGIRQVVRRTADPGVLRWTDSTGRVLLGAWRRWSPGRLEDRCVSHAWPFRP